MYKLILLLDVPVDSFINPSKWSSTYSQDRELELPSNCVSFNIQQSHSTWSCLKAFIFL